MSRGALVCLAVLCAAVSPVLGDRKLTGWTPAWISQDGKVFAGQSNVGSGNTVQLGLLSKQQGNSAAVNNAQNNQNVGIGNGGDGAVWQNNGRKLLGQGGPPSHTPAWIDQDGKVWAIQGNLLSGNTVQVGVGSKQQGNSAAVNNAQNNQNVGTGNGGDGAVWQNNGRKLLGQGGPPSHTPAWIDQDGKVWAIQGNLLSGNTVQVGAGSKQQGNSAAVNNAQNNQNVGFGNGGSGAVSQGNGK